VKTLLIIARSLIDPQAQNLDLMISHWLVFYLQDTSIMAHYDAELEGGRRPHLIDRL